MGPSQPLKEVQGKAGFSSAAQRDSGLAGEISSLVK